MKTLKSAALGALLAMALTVSVNAKEDDKPEKDKKTFSVPDTGSTVALLAFSVALLALSQRKVSRAE